MEFDYFYGPEDAGQYQFYTRLDFVICNNIGFSSDNLPVFF